MKCIDYKTLVENLYHFKILFLFSLFNINNRTGHRTYIREGFKLFVKAPPFHQSPSSSLPGLSLSIRPCIRLPQYRFLSVPQYRFCHDFPSTVIYFSNFNFNFSTQNATVTNTVKHVIMIKMLKIRN